ncbi:ABC-2 type transport system ATP-binding protein [Micromonospora jinlongensis]|uniref:ABC-2 type transport system ATP-binding protein n=1 Tax=Micromonospora jinlongensis TaxID=1287877 RepID=A0A7Y9X019_9ACTN|nr:ABC transporter ATP-binding protein [Micromonospora jinlongensis]NYH41678.1 ABC-2 type transport system ATP-binding protein [Micromonospora jinlongensis]
MDDTAVRLTGLTRRFGPVRAVDGLDLTIARGSTVALLGPNGAGKTTAISIMLGLDAADSGTATVFGRPPAEAVRAGQVGTMLQDAGWVPSATIREVVELARALYPHPLPTDRILDLAGLTERADRRLDKLSGGEAQRARFAFALAGNPDLLVLDEPTAAMDVAARQAFWAAIHQYTAEGHTVLFSTHHLHEADEFADRVVVLAAGRVVAEGPPAQIRALAGGRTVSFDLADGPIEGLDALPGVRSVQVRGQRVVLTTEDSDATVLALAGTRGFRGLEVNAAALEAAFLTLTAPGTEH